MLADEEQPLLVQLNWHKDDREGRFLLRRMDETTYVSHPPSSSLFTQPTVAFYHLLNNINSLYFYRFLSLLSSFLSVSLFFLPFLSCVLLIPMGVIPMGMIPMGVGGCWIVISCHQKLERMKYEPNSCQDLLLNKVISSVNCPRGKRRK